MKKTCIVTGGAKGIGAAISSLLAKNGYNVIINYNKSMQNATDLYEQLNSDITDISIFKADISNHLEAENLINFALQTYGSLDLLINNAGIAQQKLFIDITNEDWRKMMSVNLDGVFYCTRAALKHMVKQHSGNIINISSMWGISGASCEAHYSAAKAAVISLTKSLAKEYSPSGIRVNCVAPGVINTDMISSLNNDDLANLSNNTPLSRIGNAYDVASAVLFLASEQSSFITGQVLSVDGGYLL